MIFSILDFILVIHTVPEYHLNAKYINERVKFLMMIDLLYGNMEFIYSHIL